MSSLLSRNIHRILPRIQKLIVSPATTQSVRPFLASPASISSHHYSAQAGLKAEDHAKVSVKKYETELETLFSKLEQDSRRQGRVLARDLSRTINIIEKTQHCPPSQTLLLLKCCGEVLVDVDRAKRSQLVERVLGLLSSIPASTLDISHYNALLKVHLENHNKISLPDFMASLEQNNIQPNRVTFQHCVALYCQAGDIAGAATILQHMKENDMAINESVLLSLLSAHCVNNDPDSVSSTLSTIKNAEINVGVDVYTVMAVSYARSGNWEKVQETLEEASKESILFDDSNIFSILKACVDGDLITESSSLVERLPRKRGYFQELRNSIPHLAKSGNIPLVLELAFKHQDREGFDRSSQGAYLVSSITKSGSSVEEVVAAILRLEEAGYTLAVQQMAQEASYCWSTEKCTALKEELSKAIGDRKPVMHVGKSNSFLRDVFEADSDTDKILACLKNFQVLGVPVPQDFVALQLVPVMLDMSSSRPRDVLQKVLNICPKLAFSSLANSTLSHLLNKRSSQGFNQAVEFFLYNNIVHSKANSWNSSLCRAYLHTRDVENLTTMIFLGQRKKLLSDNDPLVSLNYLFKSLSFVQKQAKILQPPVTSDELLAPVIEDLIKNDIGVPPTVDCYKSIYDNIQSQEVKDLLVKAGKVWEDGETFWTEEKLSTFIESRKNLIRQKLRSDPPVVQRGSEEATVLSLERRYNNIQRLGKFDFKLMDQLIVKYLEVQDLVKAKEVLDYPRSAGKTFSLSPNTLDSFVTELVGSRKSGEASELILQTMDDDKEKRISGRTLKNCLIGLAEEGDHKAVMDLLEKIDKSRVYENAHSNNKLLGVYVKMGDNDKLQEVFEYLVSCGFASTGNSDNLNALIDIHMEKNDLPSAAKEFLRIANVYKRLPRKFNLTCKLIEDEDVESIQNITDVTAKLFTESKAIYDLAHCFLSLNQKSKARQLFDAPGLAYDEAKTEYIYNKLEEGNPKACEDFVAVTRNIFGCDRDLLYGKLVNTHKTDPDKVEDIWLLVQEEGLVPSDELKRQFANVLRSHKRTVPFEMPEEPLVEKDNSKLGDVDVYEAIKKGEKKVVLKIALDSIEEDSRKLSVKCKKKALEYLISQSDFDGASKLALKIANTFGDTNKINFLKPFYQIREGLGQKGEQFFNSLPPEFSKRLRSLTKNVEDSDSVRVDKEAISSDRTKLDSLLQKGDLEAASELVLKICENDNTKQLVAVKQQVDRIIVKLEQNSKVEEMKNLFDKLGPECSRILKTNYRYKTALIRRNPEKYLECLEGGDLTFTVSTEVLKGVIEQNSNFQPRLETLASSGNALAAVMMARLSLDRVEKENFVKYCRLCPPNDGSWVYEKIDSPEKFEMCMRVAEENRDHMIKIFNNYLYNHLSDVEKFVGIANAGVEKGMSINDFSLSFVKQLTGREDFKLQKEAAVRLQS